MRWFKSKKAQQNYPQLEETETSIDVSRQNSIVNLSSIHIQSNQVHVHQRPPMKVQENVAPKQSFLDKLVIFSAGLALVEDECDLW